MPTNLPPQPPQFGCTINNAFPAVSLYQPLCLASPPRRVFMSLPVMSDSESGLLGLVFYPGYATNRYFHLFSTRSITTTQGSGRHQVISRFLATANNANVALTNPFNRWAASD